MTPSEPGGPVIQLYSGRDLSCEQPPGFERGSMIEIRNVLFGRGSAMCAGSRLVAASRK